MACSGSCCDVVSPSNRASPNRVHKPSFAVSASIDRQYWLELPVNESEFSGETGLEQIGCRS